MRFADIGVNIYAITCCLARATRSKSIGLMNADYEVLGGVCVGGLCLGG